MMKDIITRKVTIEDQKIVWQWWNDPQTRQMMKLNDNVPWEVHKKWFQDILTSKTKILLMSTLKNIKLGVVRFDLQEDNIYEVSINLNPEHRGKGYGKKILKNSIDFFLKYHPETLKLFAMFKKINIASKQTFLHNEFTIVENPSKETKGLEMFDEQTEEYCEFKIYTNLSLLKDAK